MRAKLSATAAKILRDPQARQQLNNAINNNFTGEVKTADGKTYSVQRTSEVTVTNEVHHNAKPKS